MSLKQASIDTDVSGRTVCRVMMLTISLKLSDS